MELAADKGFEAHFVQWAPTLLKLRDYDVPMVVTGYTAVDGMSHDAPAVLDAARVLSIGVAVEPLRNFVVRTQRDEGRCCSVARCEGKDRTASPPTDPGLYCEARCAASEAPKDKVPQCFSVPVLLSARCAFRFEVLRRLAWKARLSRGGHLRRQEAMDIIAVTLDWALLSVLLNLAGDPESVTLERMCESFREAADPHMGTPLGRSTSCQSQVLPQFRLKHGGRSTNPEGGGTGLNCWGAT